MKNLKTIHVFDLDIYIKNNEEIRNLISRRLKDKNLSIRDLAKEAGLSHAVINHFLKGASMKIKNLEKILDVLNINKLDIEKLDLTVYSSPYKSRKYNLRFPIELSPLHIRLVSHFLGDSSLEKHGCRWYQKSDIGGNYMIKLINSLTGIKIKKSAKDSYGIPTITMDMVCSVLNLHRQDLKTPKLIEKVILLPKEYQIQLLASIIVDEGHITKSLIKIANTNLELLKELKKLVNSLGYSCSIKTYNSHIGKTIMIKNKKTKINYQLHNLLIYADGLFKLKQDLDSIVKKYGDIAGLWHKQTSLVKFSDKVNLSRLEKTRISKNSLIPILSKEISKKPIKIKEFAKKYNLDYIRAYKLFFRLKEKGEIKKISTGTFASINYKGPTNLTLRSKIEELLTKKSISIKEIANITNGKSKSIATQLSKLCKMGSVKRIKRGIYSLK